MRPLCARRRQERMIAMNNIPGTITLDETHYIDIDPYNWILKESRLIPETDSKGNPNKSAGKQVDAVIGYYGKLEDALNAYSMRILKNRLSGSAAEISIDGLQTILKEIKTAVTRLSLTFKSKQGGNAE